MNRLTSIGGQLALAYGKSLPAQLRVTGTVPVFGSNGIVGYHEEKCVSGPGIIVGRKGSVGEVLYCEGDFWPIDTTYYVVNSKGHQWRYLFYMLKHAGLTKLNSHSAVPGLNREDAYATEAWFPDEKNQQKVAAILDQITASIDLEMTALKNVSLIKNTTMKDLFTRGLRGEAQKETEIGLVPESWASVQLGQVCALSTGTTPATKNKDYYEGDIPFIKTGDVTNNRITSANAFLSQQAVDDYSLRLFPPGTILMAMYGQGKTRGQVALLGIAATTTQNAGAIQPSSEMDSAFLWHYLRSCYERLRGMGSLGHVSHLNLGYLRDLLVVKPSLNEQREISVILDALDQKITLHQQKKSVLDELFRSLLNKLMTGELSVDELDLSALRDKEPQPQTEAEVQS